MSNIAGEEREQGLCVRCLMGGSQPIVEISNECVVHQINVDVKELTTWGLMSGSDK